jgi:hypothetical protein
MPAPVPAAIVPAVDPARCSPGEVAPEQPRHANAKLNAALHAARPDRKL